MNKTTVHKEDSSASKGDSGLVDSGQDGSKPRDEAEELEIVEVKGSTNNVEIDLTEEGEAEATVSKTKSGGASEKEGQEGEKGEPEDKPPVQQRPSSVIVSVLSNAGGAKGEAKEDSQQRPPSDDRDEKAEVRRRLSMNDAPTPPPLPPPQITPYPPGSTPTPTYSPYPYSMPYPPMMFPPGGSPYPYYGYPSATQPPMPGSYIPPGMLPHPHAPPPHMDQPLSMDAMSPPHSTYGMYSSSPAPAMTTVSGVRVSVLDKPPTHLPAVSPHQIPMASARPRSTPGMYMDQQSPGVGKSLQKDPTTSVGTSGVWSALFWPIL